jgi:hypothetical protein
MPEHQGSINARAETPDDDREIRRQLGAECCDRSAGVSRLST